ncbi:hypothetical protein V6N13_062352 [Hibiscus sabdariffa]
MSGTNKRPTMLHCDCDKIIDLNEELKPCLRPARLGMLHCDCGKVIDLNQELKGLSMGSSLSLVHCCQSISNVYVIVKFKKEKQTIDVALPPPSSTEPQL